MPESASAVVSEPGRFDAARMSKRLAALPLSDPLAEGAAFLILCPLALAVALWNGFPIIFYDTGAYLLEGLGRVFLAERSPVYSLFLHYTSAGTSLWLVALAQAAMTSFVMVQAARAIAPRLGLLAMLAVAAALDLATGLPWYVGQIEPDCFVALAVLSLYLLAFHGPALAGWRGVVLTAIAGFSIGVHPSHLLLGAGLVGVMAACRAIRLARLSLRRKAGTAVDLAGSARPRMRLIPPLLACTLGLSFIIAGNYALTGKLFVSRAGPAFVFARLLQDGIVMRLLDDTCPDAHYRLCAYKEVLPRTADEWLWGRGSPFFALGRFVGTSTESVRIIRDSLVRYPGLHARAAMADAARQFVTFKTGDQIEPQEWVLSRPLEQFIPGQMRAYLAARQQQDEIGFRTLNRVHVAVGWLSLAGLGLMFAFALRQRREKEAWLAAFVFIALAGNAVICGALSNPHDRYQSRLIWLAPFALALIAGDQPIFALRGWEESGR